MTTIGSYSSKAVITGDITQTDLGDRRASGLAQALRLLSGLPGIAHIELTTADVVRHPLVRAIIKAYDADDARKEAKKKAANPSEHDTHTSNPPPIIAPIEEVTYTPPTSPPLEDPLSTVDEED